LPTKPDQDVRPGAAEGASPLVSIRDLNVHFTLRSNAVARLVGSSAGTVRAVDGVNLDLAQGEVLGLVGESGSGKSTLGRALLGLVRPTSGSIVYRDRELVGMSESSLRPLRRKLQMVFQDPHASLNPSMTVGRAISDALRIHSLYDTKRDGDRGSERDRAVDTALERVGLAPARRFSGKYPGELSGGQKQRAVIARAIALGPELLVADEPISMLDMSVRAKILGLLEELKRDLGLTYVYITHDLASARFFCDRIAIMYLGKIVEIGPTAEIFEHPRHPYTKALLSAVPDPDPSRGMARDLPRGEVPDAAHPPAGCPFHPRCPEAFAPCGWETRDIRMVLEQRWTDVPAQQYADEAELVGAESNFDDAERETGVGLLRPGTGGAEAELALLEQERDANPAEPLWTAVSAMGVQDGRVRVDFVPRAVPQLLPLADTSVEVSCHLYHPPAGGSKGQAPQRDQRA
jgi:oligopeptide/dipeptide ABC transporter ATP-binding protein